MFQTNPFAHVNTVLRSESLKSENDARHGQVVEDDKIHDYREDQEIQALVHTPVALQLNQSHANSPLLDWFAFLLFSRSPFAALPGSGSARSQKCHVGSPWHRALGIGPKPHSILCICEQNSPLPNTQPAPGHSSFGVFHPNAALSPFCVKARCPLRKTDSIGWHGLLPYSLDTF